jgi:hypothetical protein
MNMDDPEIAIEDAAALFLGKTIEKMAVPGCNQVEFRFTDGTVAVVHIECGGNGLPEVLVCTHCAVEV